MLESGHQYRLFEVPAPQAANSIQELQTEKRYWNHKFAGAHDFPKFVNGGRGDVTGTSESGHWCPGSDIHIALPLAQLRMSEPRGHWPVLDSSEVKL
jgi:hypothetical protein